MICTVCHFTLIKNWLKHMFDLTMCGRQPLVALCLLQMRMQWQNLLWPPCLPACSSQPQFLRRMSSCTAQSCWLEFWSHRSCEFRVWKMFAISLMHHRFRRNIRKCRMKKKKRTVQRSAQRFLVSPFISDYIFSGFLPFFCVWIASLKNCVFATWRQLVLDRDLDLEMYTASSRVVQLSAAE